MQPTELLYLEDMHQLECTAQVLELSKPDERDVIILDQTVFYPQGGGQPCDQGEIWLAGVKAPLGRPVEEARFKVESVKFLDGMVYHIGSFDSGGFQAGDEVKCKVNAERRRMHSRLHSAGHVVDMAVDKLGYEWIPAKGFHFPQGPYVEYSGTMDGDAEFIKTNLGKLANEFISRNISTSIKFVDMDELSKLVRHVPENLPDNKPIRVVMYGAFAVPCGGTHVSNLSDIGQITIRKVKLEKGNVRVSYVLI